MGVRPVDQAARRIGPPGVPYQGGPGVTAGTPLYQGSACATGWVVEPSESARRIESVFNRLQVPLEGELGKSDILTQKKAMGMALPAFVERLRQELDEAELTPNGERVVKLKLKQLEQMADKFVDVAPGEHFEPDELGLVAVLMEVVVALLGGLLKKEYRGA